MTTQQRRLARSVQPKPMSSPCLATMVCSSASLSASSENLSLYMARSPWLLEMVMTAPAANIKSSLNIPSSSSASANLSFVPRINDQPRASRPRGFPSRMHDRASIHSSRAILIEASCGWSSWCQASWIKMAYKTGSSFKELELNSAILCSPKDLDMDLVWFCTMCKFSTSCSNAFARFQGDAVAIMSTI
ncbi:hypothetical protein IWZ03DRAFT_391183 [Phyllosticta citriasiana]|uniref:Uncharacterized protein n=1 Tax=Phyllosticta citriasiana TaxID=595635 RepID=A0ABR1KCF4_9PEZI